MSLHVMKDIFYLVCFLFSFNIAHAQAIELITVKTFAKENTAYWFTLAVAILPVRTRLRASLGGIGAIKTVYS